MLSAALSGVWPPSKAMQRRLVARQFVPTVEAEEEQGKGSGEADAAAAGSAAAAGMAAGAGACPNSSGGNHEEGPSTSAAAAGGQAAAAAQQGKEGAAEEDEPSQVAAALGAALEQHCPGLCLADVQKAALCLRLFLGCRAVGEQASDGPNFQVCDGVASVQLLLDTTLLLLLTDCWHVRADSPCILRCFSAGPHASASASAPRRPSSARCWWTASSCWTWTLPACMLMCGPHRCVCVVVYGRPGARPWACHCLTAPCCAPHRAALAGCGKPHPVPRNRTHSTIMPLPPLLQLVLYARWPLDGRRVAALFAEGTRRSKEAKCEWGGSCCSCS